MAGAKPLSERKFADSAAPSLKFQKVLTVALGLRFRAFFNFASPRSNHQIFALKAVSRQPLGNFHGFTLPEIVMVILLMGILSTVVAVQYQDFRGEAKSAVTQNEMNALRRAITGDHRLVAGGRYSFPGYEADMASLPDALGDLVLNPTTGDKTQDYDPLIRRGWRGPYVDDSVTSDYSKDGWGNSYIYDKSNRKLRSKGNNGSDESGGGDDIEMAF